MTDSSCEDMTNWTMNHRSNVPTAVSMTLSGTLMRESFSASIASGNDEVDRKLFRHT
jgi:hypothetical protein